MPDSNSKLKAAVEDYLDGVRKIRASGVGTAEMSYYLPLGNLLNAVGGSLKPKVFCIGQLAQQGADHPDFGLFDAKQVSKSQIKQGQLPECGVVEVKPASDGAWLIADSAQVSKYWGCTAWCWSPTPATSCCGRGRQRQSHKAGNLPAGRVRCRVR